MSMPSKMPAAAPSPPAFSGQPPPGRLPLMNVSMHDDTNDLRSSGVEASVENHVDLVQPPSEISTLRCGLAALSLRSWLKLPNRCWSGLLGSSARPSTVLSPDQ